jgi:hypothetical protein
MTDHDINVLLSGDLVGDCPIHQLAEQRVMVLEVNVSVCAVLAFGKSADLHGIVLARTEHVVHDQIDMGDLVLLFGVIPKAADILDEPAEGTAILYL